MKDHQTPTWRKSSRSSATNACVEVADTGEVVGVRDSKLGKASPVLVVSPAAFAALIATITAGE